MSRKPLLWYLVPSHVLVALLALLGLGFFGGSALRQQFTELQVRNLQSAASALAAQTGPRLIESDPQTASDICRRVARETGLRVTCILPDGSVLGDSELAVGDLGNQGQFEEVARAMQGEQAWEIRYDNHFRARGMFVAVPVLGAGKVEGVVRAACSMDRVSAELGRFHRIVGALILTGAVFASAVAWAISRRAGRMLAALGEGVARYAKGDLDVRLPVPEVREMAQVAELVIRMAERLDARIQAITQQRNERNAVLASMVEAVVAVDREERIITMNDAASKMFRAPKEDVHGRPLQAVVRNTALQEFVQEALKNAEPVEREIVLHVPRDQILQAHGSLLRDAMGKPLGSVIVLNDVTNLRRLESIRRDFVANVSHELKTPITSIKGFVETLQDGACEDPVTLHRFLQIIAKQANRMNAIIEDLLTLSRIESEKENADALLKDEAILPVVESAVQLCHVNANQKSVHINIDVDAGLRGRVNAALLEQGVLNLVDNAVKYSDPGSQVWVRAERDADELVIQVVDKGRGISAEHLPRLFERFYRVDKARSREVGGTGLGLAIVKHIAQTHGGRVTVESRLGQGSTFSMHLPVVQPASPETRPTS